MSKIRVMYVLGKNELGATQVSAALLRYGEQGQNI